MVSWCSAGGIFLPMAETVSGPVAEVVSTLCNRTGIATINQMT